MIDAVALTQLVCALADRGYRVVGPTATDTAIVLAELTDTQRRAAGGRIPAHGAHADVCRYSR